MQTRLGNSTRQFTTHRQHGQNAPEDAGPSILKRLTVIARQKEVLEQRLAELTASLVKRMTKHTRLIHKCRIYDTYRQLADAEAVRNALYTERDAVVVQWVHLPLHVASKLKRRNTELDFDDLVGAGQVGLVLGAERYCPNSKATLSSYLYEAVWQKACEEARRQRSRVVNVPASAYSHPEFAQYARQASRSPQSFQYLDEDDHPTAVPETTAPVVDREDMVDLEEFLSLLPERELLVLRKRYWERWTLQEVAEELGVTRERIRQLETQAIGRLRQRMIPLEGQGVI